MTIAKNRSINVTAKQLERVLRSLRDDPPVFISRYENLEGRKTKVVKIDDLPDNLVEDLENAEYGKIAGTKD